MLDSPAWFPRLIPRLYIDVTVLVYVASYMIRLDSSRFLVFFFFFFNQFIFRGDRPEVQTGRDTK